MKQSSATKISNVTSYTQSHFPIANEHVI